MKCTKKNRLSYTKQAKELVGRMTLEQKVYLMSGNITLVDMYKARAIKGEHYNQYPYEAGGIEDLNIPALKFCDGPRGVVCGVGKTTCFPVSMNRGASFDTELEEEIGRAIGREVRGSGGNYFGGVCVNLPYNPGWGRSQEVYGEDSFALGQFGSALVRGVQEENVIACVKHYAFNSIENSRFKVSIDCDRRTEREVYLRHFKDCIDAGAASVMSAYNLYRQVHCGHSDYLLRKVLKEEWDFDGIVVSDFIMGVRNTVEAANNGMDVEMNNTKHFGPALVAAVRDGLVSEKRVDEAALRIVRTLLAFEDAYEKSGKNYGQEVLGCGEHTGLALRSAQEGIVLMQNNNGVLPLGKKAITSIAIIGKLSKEGNIGDHGSSQVYPSYVVTVVDGISHILSNAEIVYYDGENLEHAKKLAQESSAVIFVVGYDHDDEGEYVAGATESVDKEAIKALAAQLGTDMGRNAGKFDVSTLIGTQKSTDGGDRRDGLGLHKQDIELIKTVGPENVNSAVVLIGGNMIMTTEWKDSVSSILMAFYPGQEGGTAIAQILFGDVNPSAKLPFVLPFNEEDLPNVKWDTTNQYYDYYHGYAKLDKEGIKPLLPYGFGLSYTSFDIADAGFSTDGRNVTAACTVSNTGKRQGTEVVQMYVGYKNSKLDRPVKSLCGFTRVPLNAGESREIIISCPVERLQFYNAAMGIFELEHMEYEVYVGTSSCDGDLSAGKVVL